MYCNIQDFINDWKYEHEATLKVFKNLTDISLSQTITRDNRSLGFLAWHIVVTLGEMGEKAGLQVLAPSENAPEPASAAVIASAYEKAGNSFASEIKSKWNDGMLSEKIDMYGQKWTRAETLISLVKHQIHHRAQMTVLMRQAGLKVPGMYGPSQEEWKLLGMPVPK